MVKRDIFGEKKLRFGDLKKKKKDKKISQRACECGPFIYKNT